MAKNTFDLPDLGEGLTEAEILRWLVAEGDEVALDQPIVEVETAKSVVEVPSLYAGRVHTLHGAEGETLAVGAPLITLDDGEGNDAAGAPAAGQAPAGAGAGGAGSGGAAGPGAGEFGEDPADRGASYREEERAGVRAGADERLGASSGGEDAGGNTESESGSGSGNVLIGYGTTESSGTRRRRRPKNRGAEATGKAASGDGQGGEDAGRTGGASGETGGQACQSARGEAVRVVSPLVRRLAREGGLDLTALTGSGPGGLIMRRDVLAALDQNAQTNTDPQSSAGSRHEAPSGTGAGAGAAGAASSGSSTEETDARTGLRVAERTPVKGVRRAIGEAMSRSRTEIPEATVWVDVDATELLALRAHLQARDPEGAPSLLALLGRFALAGLRRHPELCSRIDGEPGSQQILRFDGVNLGIAVESERGLMVPSVRGADRMSTEELHIAMREAIQTARSGRATPAQLSGSTFTLNNYGVFGTDGATPIINHPEAAILGIGRIVEKPWVVDGQLAVRSVTTLTLAFDHRVCDGGAAGGFLRFVADAVEDPRSALVAL